MTNFNTLSIVIPCYNEERTVHLILNKIINVKLKNEIRKEIIIVDDCSKDNTIDAIRRYFDIHTEVNYQLYNHETNKGKGAAIRLGIEKATGDYIIIQDADLEYDPEEYNLLIKPILDGFADVVYGSRFLGDRKSVV